MSTNSKPVISAVLAMALVLTLPVAFALAQDPPGKQVGDSTKEQAVRDILKKLEKAPPTKLLAGDIRPIDDKGWMAHFQALVEVVKAGPAAVAVLVEALKNGPTPTRQFSAQALAFVADARARPALEAALDDPDPVVRMYAIDALSVLGRLEPSEKYQRILKEDPNKMGVRSHMAAALDRSDPPSPTALRKTLADYDLRKMNSARVGQLAPSFSLTDLMGNAYRLSQFRGKKTVVLMFVMVDC